MQTITQNDIISRLTEHVTGECSAVDVEDRYNDDLDECYDFSKIGGPFAHMSASRVLEEVDPIAYRCGLNDYTGQDDSLVEINGDYYETRKISTAQDEFVSELESTADDLEEEIESEDDPQPEDLAAKKDQLATLREEIARCQKFTF